MEHTYTLLLGISFSFQNWSSLWNFDWLIDRIISQVLPSRSVYCNRSNFICKLISSNLIFFTKHMHMSEIPIFLLYI